MVLQLEGEARQIDLVVFDCDGVLLDTMAAKILAFRRWVEARWLEHSERFISNVMGSFGKSRTYQVRWFFENCLEESPSADELAAEVDRFTEICEPLCATAGWRVGSREFVEACRAAGAFCYVLSGTPQAPLEDMLEAHGGTLLFHQIVGSPPTKPESMERILQETGVAAARTVFIGDADADARAAAHVGAHFVYFPSEANPPEIPVLTTVGDLRELLIGVIG